MSLLRLISLPPLRVPLAQRACVSAFSSLPPDPSTQTPSNTEEFDNLFSENQKDGAVDDGPPVPEQGSYTPVPATSNPLRGAVTATRTMSIHNMKPMYAVSVKASRNNTIVTFARPSGKGGNAGGQQLVTLTGGKLGFKKSNRNSYEAGYQCAVGIIGAMEKELVRTDYEWELNLNGFGQGRDAMLTAITTSVGTTVRERLRRVTDRTPLKVGGTRGKKTRRV